MAYGLDARTEVFEVIEFFNTPMLYSMYRLDRTTVPKNLFTYEVRHSDYDDADPAEIKKDVLVSFWGTLISSQPLQLDERGCRYIRPKDEWGFTGEECTLNDYMAKHPPAVKRSARER